MEANELVDEIVEDRKHKLTYYYTKEKIENKQSPLGFDFRTAKAEIEVDPTDIIRQLHVFCESMVGDENFEWTPHLEAQLLDIFRSFV
jgi:hypothetical protein